MSRAAALALSGELTIYRAAELKAALMSAVQSAPELEIDLSDVTELDSCGVQLLLLAKRAAEARGGRMRLAGHSAAVLAVFELLDLAGHFGDPIVMADAA